MEMAAKDAILHFPEATDAFNIVLDVKISEENTPMVYMILERGKQFGISRNVCNVHWHSDVIAGRMMGAAAVARLHANTDFLIDMAAAKKELATLESQ